MAKLSASALRSAAASAREKSAENAVVAPVKKAEEVKPAEIDEPKAEPKKRGRKPAKETTETASLTAYGLLHSEDGERKTEHVNLLITPTLSKKIEAIQLQGGFRSKNAAVIAVLEAYCEANKL